MKLSEVTGSSDGEVPTEQPKQKLSQLGRPETAPPAEKPSTSFTTALWHSLLRGGRDVLEGGAQIGARMMAAGPEPGAGAFDVPEQRAALPGRVDQAVQQSEQAYEQDPAIKAHPYVGMGGRIAGNIAGTTALTPGLGVGGGLGAGALRTGAGLMARGALGGAAGGAMQPVLPGPSPQGGPPQQAGPPGPPMGPQPGPARMSSVTMAPGQTPGAAPGPQPIPDFWTEKLKQVGIGATIGAAIPGVAGAISPRLPSARAVEAIPQDAGFLARSFRPLYNFFTGAEERTVNGFDRTIARQVLEPIGGQIVGRPSGHALLRETEQQISAVYDRTLPHIQLPKAAATAPNRELDDYVATMSADHIRRYNELIDRTVNSHFATTSVMDGTTFQRARELLGRRARSWIGTNDEELGQAVQMKINNLQEAVVASNPPHLAEPLRQANESWRLWARMRAAGNKPGRNGDFTPDDLLGTVYRQSRGASWRGDQPLQGYAQAGRAALGSDKFSLRDLAQIFHRHGLIGKAIEETTGPLARGAKTATPALAPGAGAFESRREQEDRGKQRLKAAGKVGELKNQRSIAMTRGNFEDVQEYEQQLASARRDYRDLGGTA